MAEHLPLSTSNGDEVVADPWGRLCQATPARIALGRAGGSLPTREWLDFRAAHAAARDAVLREFHADALAAELAATGLASTVVSSAAADRPTFLRRPDLGRRLDAAGEAALRTVRVTGPSPNLAVIVSDGLSALAVHRQAPPLLADVIPRLKDAGWRLAPIVIARFGRVALQDAIGQLLGAELALTLIGERPGLGSPDSLGAYFVYSPRPGNTDANRNCLSNIRPEGLAISDAADTLCYLLNEARHRRLSGVQLKDQRVLGTGEP